MNTPASDVSEVFFAPVSSEVPMATQVETLYRALGVKLKRGGLVALKTHFGEEGNTTHVAPAHLRTLVDLVKAEGALPFLTETSVLYKSRRSNAVEHILLAYQHGFTYEAVGAPIILCDGLKGNLEREVEIHGDHYNHVAIAADAGSPDHLILVSHATGHLAAGFGAALKNLGMGLSARKGKLDQHSASKPYVKPRLCEACGDCIRHCPVDAISMKGDAAFIDEDLCIGCGECITACIPGAVGFKWDGASADLQRKMAEHAFGVAKLLEGRFSCFNFLTHMTQQCDCLGASHQVMPDLGILASLDPVAIDMATLDLTRERAGQDLGRLTHPELDPMVQIDHAEKLGLGRKAYRLTRV